MLKAAFILFLGLLLFQKADAQTDKDTVLYYMKNSGHVVVNKDSADYALFIMPRDAGNNGLFPVAEYYPDGKRRLIGTSVTQSSRIQLDGPCITYFPNGRKKSIIMYKLGFRTGDITAYFPNGKSYSLVKHDPDNTVGVLYMECRDSTGNVQTQDGNGKWIDYTDDFTLKVGEGIIKNGNLKGIMQFVQDTSQYSTYYKTGDIVLKPDVHAEFKGGINAFFGYLRKNIRYPGVDMENSIQGIVLITFIIEKNGTLTHLRIEKAPSENTAKEALRVMSLSPDWIPGTVGGVPVRTTYTIPISFSLAKD